MRHRKYPFIVGFLFVPVVLYALLVVWPYIQTFGYSLTDWSGESQTMHFVGFKNYSTLFSDHIFLTALLHNALLLVFLPVITILLALFFAFMLNVGGRGGTGGVQGVRGRRLLQGGLLLPAGAVLRDPRGALPGGLPQRLRRPAQRDPGQARPGERAATPSSGSTTRTPVLWCLLAIMVWASVGFYLVLFSAAMQSIPKDIYEAALLDGAGRSETFFRITMPLLWDSVQTAWVYLAIIAMDFFALVSTLTPGVAYGGGPDYHSEVLSTYLMRNFLFYGKSGYACAMGVVILFFTLIVSVFALRVTRRERVEF